MAEEKLTIPDIGGVDNVDVIEVFVKAGDHINQDESVLTLESDKASMEVPSPESGIVKEVHIALGDKVCEGDDMITIELAGEAKATSIEEKSAEKPVNEVAKPQAQPANLEAPVTTSQSQEICVPDIGGASDVDVIEVNIKTGDQINEDNSLITLESDKASMEVPSPVAGVVEAVKIKVGDKASEGTLIAIVKADVAQAQPGTAQKPAPQKAPEKPASIPSSTKASPSAAQTNNNKTIYAGPAVRRLARELGVDLSKVNGSGQKGRLLTDDVKRYVKETLSNSGSRRGGLGFNLPPLTPIDFSKFGDITTKPLNKIKRLTGSFLHRNWLTVPHVTQFGDADITDLEAFRKQYKGRAEKEGFKLTPIVFVMKAVVAALKAYPQFNASLDETGENLILKQYYHIGVAVDTPNGLVVPVIRDVDQKGIFELAKEIGEISKQAREKGLTPSQMQGGCFSISSLGGIGGTAFTPIVNLPEVAILGLSKSAMKPVYQHGEFIPRLMLPMSLSYDHRVIDGADGARFITYLADGLADLRLALL